MTTDAASDVVFYSIVLFLFYRRLFDVSILFRVCTSTTAARGRLVAARHRVSVVDRLGTLYGGCSWGDGSIACACPTNSRVFQGGG